MAGLILTQGPSHRADQGEGGALMGKMGQETARKIIADGEPVLLTADAPGDVFKAITELLEKGDTDDGPCRDIAILSLAHTVDMLIYGMAANLFMYAEDSLPFTLQYNVPQVGDKR